MTRQYNGLGRETEKSDDVTQPLDIFVVRNMMSKSENSQSMIRPIIIKAGSAILVAVVLYYLGIEYSNFPPITINFGKPPTTSIEPSRTDKDDEGNKNGVQRDNTFEKMKQATLQAWEEMQNIDMEFYMPYMEAEEDTYQNLIASYTDIDLSDVDPLLKTHIRKSIAVYRQVVSLHKKFETELQQLERQSGYDLSYEVNMLLELQRRFQPEFDEMPRKLNRLNSRDKSIARELTSKYNVPFSDHL